MDRLLELHFKYTARVAAGDRALAQRRQVCPGPRDPWSQSAVPDVRTRLHSVGDRS